MPAYVGIDKLLTPRGGDGPKRLTGPLFADDDGGVEPVDPRAFGESGIPWRNDSMPQAQLTDPNALSKDYTGLQSFSQDKSRGNDQLAVSRLVDRAYKPMLDDPGDARRAEGLTPTRDESANEDAYVNAQAGQWSADAADLEADKLKPQFDPEVYQLERHRRLMEANAQMAELEDKNRMLEYRAKHYAETGRIPSPEDDKIAEARYHDEAIRNDVGALAKRRTSALEKLKSLPDGAEKQALQADIQNMYQEELDRLKLVIDGINKQRVTQTKDSGIGLP